MLLGNHGCILLLKVWNVMMAFLVTFLDNILAKSIKKKAIDMILECTGIPATNFIELLSLDLPSFFKDRAEY